MQDHRRWGGGQDFVKRRIMVLRAKYDFTKTIRHQDQFKLMDKSSQYLQTFGLFGPDQFK